MKRARPSDPRGQSACANIITKREKKKKQKEKKKHVAEIGVDFTLIYLPRSSSIPFTTEYKIFSVAVLTTQGVVTYTLRWKNRIDEIRFCARSFIKCARQLKKKIPSLSLDCCSTSPIFSIKFSILIYCDTRPTRLIGKIAMNVYEDVESSNLEMETRGNFQRSFSLSLRSFRRIVRTLPRRVLHLKTRQKTKNITKKRETG